MIHIDDLIDNSKNECIYSSKVFTESILTSNVSFITANLHFVNCIFYGSITLYGNIFENVVIFEDCVFETMEWHSCTFKKALILKSCTFNREFGINSCLFEDKVTLSRNSFNMGVNFFKGNYDNGSIEFLSGLIIE